MIKIAIADDHPIAVNGINMMLSGQADISIETCYATGQALLDGLAVQQPDVLLLDILLPDYNGNELAAIIAKQYPEVRIVVLTSLDAPAMVKSMLHHGCIAYLLKGTDRKSVV